MLMLLGCMLLCMYVTEVYDGRYVGVAADVCDDVDDVRHHMLMIVLLMVWMMV